MSNVYFTKDISSNGLIKAYAALGRNLAGRVAVKISSGESGGHNYLDPNLIKDLVKKLNGTIVECNTAYGGSRSDSKKHWQTIKEHGFLDIANVDIMDEEGEFAIPLEGGKHLHGKNYVGGHIKNYDSMLMLSHYKGHMMAGMGGALKNMSIGVASANGKAWIHSVGRTTSPQECWSMTDDQDGFLESMAEADKAVVTYFKPENMLYINVLNKLSVDCDCDSNPAEPEMQDIGILASRDPVALDQASYDMIINSKDSGKDSLIERMNSRHAIHIVEEAENLGLGSHKYKIVSID